MRKVVCVLSIILMLSSGRLFANDPYFSQFYNAPLILNPALTGIAFGNIRIMTNYRNHLASIDPFQTYSVGIDMSLFEKNEGGSFAGIGLVATNDLAGSVQKNLRAMFSLAYHKSIGSNKNNYLAIGFQGGIDQTDLNFTNLTTQSQWVPGSGVDRSLSNGELISGDNQLLMDFQAGLLWYSFLNNGSTIFAGVSAFHLTEPNKSFTGIESKLSRRYVVHAGSRLSMSPNFNLVPNVVFMRQGSVNIIHSGVAFEYDKSVNNDYQVFSIGAWLRNTDAVIMSAGLEYKRFSFGLSYDLIISNLSEVTQKGGFEISLAFNFKKSISKVNNLSSDPNPRL
ncbi:PorP/SprF family type IX secretion system membrane protein [Fulvivirgaceae bacterium BMA10]|uniref:PorP/SprF family type IX secretion system membrane protein n=1 Tax=Splendidivirga corallicola TaxID=3051826 RepID=A0ABT8KI06_9BACT|nr:PorP/SprF family type IX secretion system membrane protein [Fulvivirgaceae bacterium BMA10]